jgi:hypothetical protein
MDKEQAQVKLRMLLESMDVPEMRRDVSNDSNLRWLNRNLMVRNSEHPSAVFALVLAGRLLRGRDPKGAE